MSASTSTQSSFSSFVFTRFGRSETLILNKNINLGSWPLISQFTYSAAIGVLSAIAFGVGLGRLFLRHRRYGRWDRDDALFTVALVCLVVSAIFNIYCSEIFYIMAQISTGAVFYADPKQLVPGAIRYLQIINSVTAVQWLAIYSVKLCYLLFFHKLTSRVRPLRIWWWVTLAITVPSLFVACLSGLTICSDFSNTIFITCDVLDMYNKSIMATRISSVLDIVTDAFIVAIPMLLLARLKIDRTRKLTIVTILSLSLAMVIVAIIRLFPPYPGVSILDVTWFFFWMAFETALAVIMVSITAFRGIFQSSSTRGTSEASPTPNSFQKFKQGLLSSKMGKYFVWSSRSGDTTLGSTDEAPKVPRKDTVKHNTTKSFFFQWETNLDTVDEKSYADSATLGMPTRSWATSVKSGSLRSTNTRHDDLVSLPSIAFSPLSSMNQSISPMSTQQDRHSRYYSKF